MEGEREAPSEEPELPLDFTSDAHAIKAPPCTVQELLTKTVISETPLTGEGVQIGKVLLTFADGTRAIFKPASGEIGHKPKD